VQLTLLGTGAADGWPSPFCGCASCASLRAEGLVRAQTAVLVDDDLLLDAGPEAPRAAERLGRPLTELRHVLVTHAHTDHLAPAFLTWRHWARVTEPLDLVGPPGVHHFCQPWTGPADPIRPHVVAAGDRLTLGRYEIRVLAANHGDDVIGAAVLYDITGDGGARVLYATDTGRLPPASLDATTGAAYDVVLLEETWGDERQHPDDHLDLSSFAETVRALRRNGAITPTTRVVAIHLGDGNPPTAELRRRLGAWGVDLLPDGAVLTVGSEPAPPRRSARRVLVLGGARSGKSLEAERRLATEPVVTYVATADPIADDSEWSERIATHRSRRPPEWSTVETREVADLLCKTTADDPPLLVDCVTLWLAAEIGSPRLAQRVDDFVEAWTRSSARVVAVSNEVGSGVVPPTADGRAFRDALGGLNARLAATADEVWLVTAGVPQRLR
jgi:adenosylcobinamide kinase/adenosylcobinamide-phosphate guanylyltransferase